MLKFIGMVSILCTIHIFIVVVVVWKWGVVVYRNGLIIMYDSHLASSRQNFPKPFDLPTDESYNLL